MNSQWVACAVGLAAGAGVGALGLVLGVSTSGAMLLLAIVGAVCFRLGGWNWGATLLVGMLSSLLWARYRAVHSAGRRAERRGWLQLAAMLGWAAILAALSQFGGRGQSGLAAFLGAIAATTADAWAGEVGALSPQRPRMITSGRRVPVGTPGGVTLLGSVAALGGAWLVGLTGMALTVWRSSAARGGLWDRALLWLPLSVALGGVAGALLDGFLGATAQAYYHCEACGEYCEKPVHTCGRRAAQVRGWWWLTGEGVDVVSSIVGAALAAALYVGLANSSVPW